MMAIALSKSSDVFSRVISYTSKAYYVTFKLWNDLIRNKKEAFEKKEKVLLTLVARMDWEAFVLHSK